MLQVLSVVAQQVLSIVRAKSAKLKTFVLEGADIPLKPTCNVFITMNPGYAGAAALAGWGVVVQVQGWILETLSVSPGMRRASHPDPRIRAFRCCATQEPAGCELTQSPTWQYTLCLRRAF